MNDTPLSLLERLRVGPDPASWRRLVDLYEPFVRHWLRRQKLQPADIDDLTQDVLAVVVRELPAFRHDLRPGAFRRWLCGIALNRLRTHWRARRPESAGGIVVESAAPEALQRLWDEEHDRHVIRRLLDLLEPEFEPATWSAFRLLVLEEVPAARVAESLGLTVNAVRIAKSRVLARLRRESEGLID